MRTARSWTPVLAVLLLAASAGTGMGSGGPPQGHKQLFAGQWFHAPVADDDCTVCHTLHREGRKPFLQLPEPELCYQCHENFGTQDVVHEPVGSGRCSDCHQVHTSDVRPLLKARIPQLCIACHPLDPKHVGRNTVCISCHGVHSSETSRFLKDDRTRNCKRCHESKHKGARVHEPARGGKCLTCHYTHPDPRFASERLRAPFPRQVRTAFAPGLYGLCDRCHPQALYQDPGYEETGFRTRSRNLHERHVVQRKVGCAACHDVHTARRSALIVEWVRLPGAKPVPLQFLSFSTGGSCGPACHATATYVRDEDKAEFGGDDR